MSDSEEVLFNSRRWSSASAGPIVSTSIVRRKHADKPRSSKGSSKSESEKKRDVEKGRRRPECSRKSKKGCSNWNATSRIPGPCSNLTLTPKTCSNVHKKKYRRPILTSDCPRIVTGKKCCPKATSLTQSPKMKIPQVHSPSRTPNHKRRFQGRKKQKSRQRWRRKSGNGLRIWRK